MFFGRRNRVVPDDISACVTVGKSNEGVKHEARLARFVDGHVVASMAHARRGKNEARKICETIAESSERRNVGFGPKVKGRDEST
ncbi:MAG: hypothetical protein NVSMB14_11240 [Isosphaeraceae bacterium]